MSILGLICVVLALVATLFIVLCIFQRRDLRAISELSLNIQRAIANERLPQRIEIDPEHEGQLDVQALGVSVNQLLLRAARTAGRERDALDVDPVAVVRRVERGDHPHRAGRRGRA